MFAMELVGNREAKSPIVRIAEPADAAAIQAIYAPFCDTSTVSFDAVAPTVEQMAQRMARILPRYPWLVCEIGGEVAGYVYASQHRERAAYRWAVEVAVYIAPTHQRCGIGRALYTSLFGILRQQEYFKALAGITLPNEGSIGLHEAMGFRQIAAYPGIGHKLGHWLDVGWWQLALQPERADPPEPRAFEQVRHSSAVEAALAAGGALLSPAMDIGAARP
jgi:phosphinothricin acetyltransferase